MFSIQGITNGLTNRKNLILVAAAVVAGFIIFKRVIQ